MCFVDAAFKERDWQKQQDQNASSFSFYIELEFPRGCQYCENFHIKCQVVLRNSCESIETLCFVTVTTCHAAPIVASEESEASLMFKSGVRWWRQIVAAIACRKALKLLRNFRFTWQPVLRVAVFTTLIGSGSVFAVEVQWDMLFWACSDGNTKSFPRNVEGCCNSCVPSVA